MASLTSIAPAACAPAFEAGTLDVTDICQAFLTTRSGLAVTRSLSDGQWATADQLCEATGVTPVSVTRVLDCLAMGGYLEQVDDRVRMDPAAARRKIAQVFAATLAA